VRPFGVPPELVTHVLGSQPLSSARASAIGPKTPDLHLENWVAPPAPPAGGGLGGRRPRRAAASAGGRTQRYVVTVVSHDGSRPGLC
jgi:hypothetical protein